MDLQTVLPELRATIESGRDELIGIASDIWNHPELSFKEFRASKLLTDKLRSAGFEVEYPYAGLDTAFRAEYTYGEGGATFALAAEYDALPGIGHACGHNLIGVAAVAAAVAAKAYMEKHRVAGTVVVLGTPGEEGGGGKVRMLRNSDCLKNVDAVMMAHGSGDATAPDNGSTAIRRYDVIFHGKASHAAGSPEKGVNALDAQVLLLNAIGLYRQQMDRRALIHGVVLEGGEAANVIPDRTRGRFYLRSPDEAVVDRLYERFTKMVEGAALMTGTTYEISMVSIPYKARRPNRVLNELFMSAAAAMGMPLKREGRPPLGSSDFGDFSQAAPGTHADFGINPSEKEVPGHSEAFKLCANSSYGHEQMLKAGACLAACALAVLSDPETRAAVRADFERR